MLQRRAREAAEQADFPRGVGRAEGPIGGARTPCFVSLGVPEERHQHRPGDHGISGGISGQPGCSGDRLHHAEALLRVRHRMITREDWKALEEHTPEGVGRMRRRVHPLSERDVFISFSGKGASPSCTSTRQAQTGRISRSTRGIAVSREAHAGCVILSVELTDPHSRDNLERLVNDSAARIAESPTDEAAAGVGTGRLTKWSRLLRARCARSVAGASAGPLCRAVAFGAPRHGVRHRSRRDGVAGPVGSSARLRVSE